MSDLRIGLGVDAHALVEGVPLVLGGVELDFPHGLAGHSDGDVTRRGGTHGSPASPLLRRCVQSSVFVGSRRAKPGSAAETVVRGRTGGWVHV